MNYQSMHKILSGDEIADGINFLNSKHKEVFAVVQTSAKYYVKYDWRNIELVHISISGNGGTNKSYLVKVIYINFFITGKP